MNGQERGGQACLRGAGPSSDSQPSGLEGTAQPRLPAAGRGHKSAHTRDDTEYQRKGQNQSGTRNLGLT